MLLTRFKVILDRFSSQNVIRIIEIIYLYCTFSFLILDAKTTSLIHLITQFIQAEQSTSPDI